MMDEVENAPVEVSRLAGRCLTHVKNRTGIELDYKIETLSVLDFFAQAILTEEGAGSLPPVGDHLRSDAMHLFAPTMGAYFGEVVRNTFPCRWRIDTDDPRDWIIEFNHVPLRFKPVGAAAEALVEQYIVDGGCAFATAIDQTEALTERLEAAPPIPEDEFFSFSTRLEVLQISVDWLRVRLNAGSTKPPRYYSQEDYDTLFES